MAKLVQREHTCRVMVSTRVTFEQESKLCGYICVNVGCLVQLFFYRPAMTVAKPTEKVSIMDTVYCEPYCWGGGGGWI